MANIFKFGGNIIWRTPKNINIGGNLIWRIFTKSTKSAKFSSSHNFFPSGITLFIVLRPRFKAPPPPLSCGKFCKTFHKCNVYIRAFLMSLTYFLIFHLITIFSLVSIWLIQGQQGDTGGSSNNSNNMI